MSARLASLSFAALLLVACDASVKVDPEGYRCDPGNSCPSGYACGADGACHRGGPVDTSCANVTCDSPPAATCSNGTTLQTHVGRCLSGVCTYTAVDMACASMCSNGACVDPCANVSCVTPPGPACVDANTLRTFATTGTCGNGQCTYQQTDTSCPNGCSNGVCSGADLCRTMNVVCNMPPAAVCVGNARRTFASSGTCDPGTGTCNYGTQDMVCPNGCAQGQCLTAALTITQLGPRVRFAVNALDVAPSSSGNSAIAVGDNGKLARWDGATWSEVNTNTTNKLNSVAFVTGSVAYVVGDRTTALTVRNSGVMPVALSGGGNTNLVAVSGRSEGEVLIAGAGGEYWRQRAGNWSNGNVPSSSGTPTMVAAFMDESQRERIVGRCGSARCTAYRNASGGTPMWTVQTQSGSTGFSAVGGAFDIPSSGGSIALEGAALELVTHDATLLPQSPYGSLSPTSALEGGSVVGVTAQAVSVARDVYVLTSSSGSNTGHLYRLNRTLTVVTPNDALQTYYGEEHLSPNDANGVLVAEVRRSSSVNNIFRRGVLTNEALDVGEDFVGASADSSNNLFFTSEYGDVVIRRQGSATFEFHRPPAYDWAIGDAEARNGTGVLLVGEDVTNSNGLIARYTLTGFATLASPSGAAFTAVCRVSDSEAWAVGKRGVIYKINGTSATAVTSPTTNDLLAVDCAAGVAVACGANGTVLRLSNGTWASVSTGLGATGDVTACRLSGQSTLVGGDGFLSVLQGTSWTALAGQAGLDTLIIKGPNEVYGTWSTAAGTSNVSRFDGSRWTSLSSVTGVLGGGVQVGGRVVWGGTLGAIVEGR